MDIKLFFLGTGTSQGVPMLGCSCNVCKSSDPRDKRLRTSVIVKFKNKNILIDSGPDFRYQMLRSNFRTVDAILFTHQHRDHTAGLDDLRAVYYLNKKPISMYAESRVFDYIKTEFSYMFGPNYPGQPKFDMNNISNHAFSIFGIEILPIRAMHHKLPVLGFKIGGLTYITDANYISESEKKKFLGTDILILNSLQIEKHISHYNLEDSLSLIEEIKPRKAYLTHIGHKMGLHSEVQKKLPTNVHLAYDNLCIQTKY